MEQMILTSLKIIALVYVGLGVVLYLFQNRLLYLPKTFSLSAAQEAAQSQALALWPDANDAQGFIGVHEPAQPIGTVLVFHGNAGAAIHRAHYVEVLASLGFRVILLEYPGYGHRPGAPGQRSFVAAATRALDTAQTRYPEPLYVLGESLGSGVAAAAVKASQAPIQGVLLVTPWDTLPDLAQTVYWYFPTKWLTRDRYDSIRNLADFTGPVAIVMAGQDQVIPNKHTQRLYDALTGNKRLFRLEQAGHNNWMDLVDAAWWQDIAEFLTSGDTAN